MSTGLHPSRVGRSQAFCDVPLKAPTSFILAAPASETSPLPTFKEKLSPDRREVKTAAAVGFRRRVVPTRTTGGDGVRLEREGQREPGQRDPPGQSRLQGRSSRVWVTCSLPCGVSSSCFVGRARASSLFREAVCFLSPPYGLSRPPDA